MSVLNAVNGKEIDEVYELMKPAMIIKEKERQQFMNDFLKKRNDEPDLKVNDKPNAVPEFESVCSENTRDMWSDDDDDDDGDDDLSTERAIDNMENMLSDKNSNLKKV